MLSLGNPPQVLEASEDPIRTCWIALGTNGAGEMCRGINPGLGGILRINHGGQLWRHLHLLGAVSAIKLSRHAIFKALGFPLPHGLVEWIGPIPKETQADSSLVRSGINTRGLAPF